MAGLSISANDIILAVAILASPLLLKWMTDRSAKATEDRQIKREAEKEKKLAETETAKTEAAESVQRDTAEAARLVVTAAETLAQNDKDAMARTLELIDVVRSGNGMLGDIQKDGKHTLTIVNSEKSGMVGRIAVLTKLVAKLLPNDTEAQKEAVEAQSDFDKLSEIAKKLPDGGEVHE